MGIFSRIINIATANKNANKNSVSYENNFENDALWLDDEGDELKRIIDELNQNQNQKNNENKNYDTDSKIN